MTTETTAKTTTGFKVWVIADSTETYCTNGVVYEDRELAVEGGHDIASRWMAVRKWDVRPTDEPVTRFRPVAEVVAPVKPAKAAKLTVADIRAANAEAGFHFFDRKTLRFFSTKVESIAYTGAGGTYFVTSEQMDPSTARMFTVRYFNPISKHVNTATTPSGGRMTVASRQWAREAAKALAKGN